MPDQTQTQPDAIAAIDAALADTEPVRAATVHSSRSEILADLQAVRGHHKGLVTVLNATREALHLPADCDRNAIPAAARNLADQLDLARVGGTQLQTELDEMRDARDVLRHRLDQATAAGRTIAAIRDIVEQLDRAGVTIEALDRALAAYDAPSGAEPRPEVHEDPARLRQQLADAHADCARYATERDEARAQLATLAQIRRDADQHQADLAAGRVADHLGEPPPGDNLTGVEIRSYHVTRGCGPTDLEANCPCGKAPCGAVDTERTHPDCDQHPVSRNRTMRQIHRADQCPASEPTEDLRSPLAAERDSLVETIGRLVSLPPDDIARMHKVGYTGTSAVAPVPPARVQDAADGCGSCWACRAADLDDPAARVLRDAIDWRQADDDPSAAEDALGEAVDAMIAAPACVDLSVPAALGEQAEG